MTEGSAFDVEFARRASRVALRPERTGDRMFLIEQFIACSPYANILPMPVLRRQATLQLDAHNHAHPDAMRRIVLIAGDPIARIMVDWGAGASHGIDLAVLSAFRPTGVGLHLLRAWLAVCDATCRVARLEVRIDNPARKLYRHLGFAEAGEDCQDGPIIVMERAFRPIGLA